MNSYSGNDSYAFISYAHLDENVVLPIIQHLQGEGYRVWYDEGIEAGTEWAKNIAEHLSGASCVIAFITNHYLKSEHCLDEIEHAKNKSIRTLVIYLEDVNPPEWFEMRHNRTQAIIFSQYCREEDFYKRLQEAHILDKCKKSIRGLLDENLRDLSETSYSVEKLKKTGFVTEHVIDSGMIGDNATWELESNGDLRINGSGELNCSSLYGQTLDSVIVDSHLKSVKDRVKRLFIGEGIETIGEFSFYHFFHLSEVYVSYTVKKIAAGAFKDCKNLRHLELPWQLKEIGLYAFQNCYSLENFDLPDEVVISSEAFKDCHALTALEKHGNKSITIFQKTFENCTSLEKVELENVNLVGMYAFKGCVGLNYVELSFRQDGLIKKGQTLQSHALSFSGVKEVHLAFPSLIKLTAIFYGIEDNCFEGCDKLTDVFFEDEIPYISDNAFSQQSHICIHVSEKAHGIQRLYRALGEDCKIRRCHND